MAKLENNQIVKNRRGDVGCVVSFKGEPVMIVYAAYTFNVSRLDENLKAKNHDYDIVEVHNVEDVSFKGVFSRKLALNEETLLATY
jgi:hypothetical protein